MLEITDQMTKSAGLPPGTPVFVGTQKTERARIRVIDYDTEHLLIEEIQNVEECFPYKDRPSVTWINVDGIHDTTIVERLGKHFGLHVLMIEDILNTQQRLKVDVFDEYILIILKMIAYDNSTQTNNTEQVSIVLGQHFVLTFQEREGDVFDIIRTRLQNDRGRLRRTGADYLAYGLLDAVVDGYFEVIERFGEQIALVEEDLIKEPDQETLHNIHRLRRELIFFRNSVWPLRNMINQIIRQETPLIEETTLIYLRDLYDHTLQVIETIETFRDMMTGILEVYMSSMSNKMNEIMQFLTIIGTIFIPLTFIAGVYGMNFHYMPELDWKWGYFIILGVMAVIGSGLLLYFKKKKWL
ncbi:magnesium transport protein [Candidatus Vecturithrix granuli]|uniref:Magnesium transport protein CorA n=1 Tax=Vecturithrix granuli TaxID=1499967 RepID=A0A081C849_VECG1|nr:magnesium transport protein [Candidatus Vecturithrix granuli]